MANHDAQVLHELAEQYAEICARAVQEERRTLWRDHNSLVKTRVPIICSWYWGSLLDATLLADDLVCADPFYRHYELWLRNRIFHETLGDDTIQEPWITVRAAHRVPAACQDGATWGIAYERERRAESGAWVTAPSVSRPADLARLVAAPHAIDGEETTLRADKLREAVGDVLTVNVSRAPFYECYGGSDLCEALTYLMGVGNLMLYLREQPELVRAALVFMRDAVLAQYRQAEAAGDWGRTDNFNMGMPYARELPDPRANCYGAPRKELWFFTCAQAFTLVSPRMFEEFMLNYQLPIMAEFGLTSYACCEDVTHKIKALRKVPNLRRIGVPPVSNLAQCAEQIGTDYVLSWKPNPALVGCGFEEDVVRKVMRAGLHATRGCVVDIMLKDVSTVEGQPERLKQWTQIARELVEAN
jgi:hypothetical protein